MESFDWYNVVKCFVHIYTLVVPKFVKINPPRNISHIYSNSTSTLSFGADEFTR